MRNRWLGFVIAAVALAVSVWAWPRLPARVPTHWEVHGVPDGYSSRLAAALIVPAIVVAMNGLFSLRPCSRGCDPSDRSTARPVAPCSRSDGRFLRQAQEVRSPVPAHRFWSSDRLTAFPPYRH